MQKKLGGARDMCTGARIILDPLNSRAAEREKYEMEIETREIDRGRGGKAYSTSHRRKHRSNLQNQSQSEPAKSQPEAGPGSQ